MSVLAGLKKDSCPAACSVNSCVIAAGLPLCFHPCGSGVPFNYKNDPAIQKRYAEACTLLGVKNLNEPAGVSHE